MTLQDLVKLKLSILVDTNAAEQELARLVDSIQTIETGVQDLSPGARLALEDIAKHYQKIANDLTRMPAKTAQLIEYIDIQIAAKTATWDRRGYMTNGFYGASESTLQSEREHRNLGISSDTRQLVQSRIEHYVDWRYPGLEIGPGAGTWTKSLVACDPLYVCDIYDEFLAETKMQFPANYQARLRTYKIDPASNSLAALPQNQFGFVFAWNVFNFFPKVELTHYLRQIFQVLRPGGVAMFSYNDCDRAQPADFAEIGWMSWMPKSQLVPLVDSLGFELVHAGESESNVSWLEIRKPGQLVTAKAHQVLGEIKSSHS
mgnify:CR=1 FL=1